MRRHIKGLGDEVPVQDVPNGLFLVRVESMELRYRGPNHCFLLRFSILEPSELAGRAISGRLQGNEKVGWKVGWFLREFGYNRDLITEGEMYDKALIGLQGVIQISRRSYNRTLVVNFEGFAPASRWKELSSATTPSRLEPEVP